MEAIRVHPFVARLDRSIRLEARDLMALDRLLSRRVVAKKAKEIIVEGYKYEALHVVECGIAIRYRLLESGKRQIVNVVLPGDIIGFPACFYEHAVFSVSAVGDMKLSHVPLDAFTALCLEHATIATALVWFAAREASIYAEHIVDAGRREPLPRVAHFILEMLTRLQAVGLATETRFDMPLSQEAIGDVVGLSGPHVNRMIAELRAGGLIAVDGREIAIRDRAGLEELGGFQPAYLTQP